MIVAVAFAGNSGARDDEIEVAALREVRAGNDLDLGREVLEAGQAIPGAFIGGDDACPVCNTELGGTSSRDAEPQDQDPVAFTDDFFLGHDPHRSFNEDKATSPRMIETIQNRTTIFCSGQPSFS